MDCIASRPPDKPFQYRIALRYFCASQAHVHNPRAHTLLMLFEAVHAAILQGMDPNLPITTELHCFEYQEIFDHQTPCLSNECGREFADNGREPYTINADGQRYRSGCAADGVGDVVLSFRECNLEEGLSPMSGSISFFCNALTNVDKEPRFLKFCEMDFCNAHTLSIMLSTT